MPNASKRVYLIAVLALLAGCESDQTNKTIKKTTKQTVEAGQVLANKATDQAKKLTEQLADDIPDGGELSETAMGWLRAQAHAAGVEALVAKGIQVAPVTMQIGAALNAAIDSDTMVEPIYQPIDQDQTEAVDKAIRDMPKVEVIDGLTVGLKQYDKFDGELVKERGYLVTWRHEDHLIGFVYRSKREIDIGKLAEQTPKLVRATQAALNG